MSLASYLPEAKRIRLFGSITHGVVLVLGKGLLLSEDEVHSFDRRVRSRVKAAIFLPH